MVNPLEWHVNKDTSSTEHTHLYTMWLTTFLIQYVYYNYKFHEHYNTQKIFVGCTLQLCYCILSLYFNDINLSVLVLTCPKRTKHMTSINYSSLLKMGCTTIIHNMEVSSAHRGNSMHSITLHHTTWVVSFMLQPPSSSLGKSPRTYRLRCWVGHKDMYCNDKNYQYICRDLNFSSILWLYSLSYNDTRILTHYNGLTKRQNTQSWKIRLQEWLANYEYCFKFKVTWKQC